MTDDPLDRSITVTLSLGQIFAIRDLIAESLDLRPTLSPAATHHAVALRAVDETLEIAMRTTSMIDEPSRLPDPRDSEPATIPAPATRPGPARCPRSR